MTDAPSQFPGVSMFWELTNDGVLTLALRAPQVYARQFPLPGDMIYQFLMAVQSRGIDVEDTESVRVRFDKNTGAFLVRWSGRVLQNPELVYDVIPALTRQLGIAAHGES